MCQLRIQQHTRLELLLDRVETRPLRHIRLPLRKGNRDNERHAPDDMLPTAKDGFCTPAEWLA
jgi:hypothetical protein